MNRRTVSAWRIAHKYSSLVCTAFLLLLCVTGLPLIFHDEIDGWLAPATPLAAAPGARPLDLDRLLGLAMARRPGEVPIYMSFDEDRPVVNVTSAATPDAAAAAMHFQSLDRRTGAVVPPSGSRLMALILQLHTDLLLGATAELFLGAMGLLFFVAMVSGVVLYAPFMARLPFGVVRHDLSARTQRLDRHNLIGVVTLMWASVVGLTGTINTLATPITDAWKRGELATIAAPGPIAIGRLAPLQPAMDRVLRAARGTRPQFIAFPGAAYSSHRHYGIFLQGATPLTRRLLTPAFVDARSGRLDALDPMPWYMQALLLAQPLHFGDYAGLPMKLLWAALDLLTIALLVTGLRLWVARPARPRR